MLRRVTIFLLALLFLPWSHFPTAAAASSKNVNRALASAEPVVLIGVPAAFLHPETIGDDSAESQSDWAFYLNEWIQTSASKKKLKIVVVPMNILAGALKRPVLKGYCATLFVKNKTEGLLFDAYCVPQIADYDVGANWLEGTASPHDIAEHGFKTTAVVARAGNERRR
jgi:hypothetical protein